MKKNKNTSNASKQTYSFRWKNMWLFFIFLAPLIYTITTYYLSCYDSYFIDLLSPISSFIEMHWKVTIWGISIIFIVQWNSCISFIKNIGSKFISVQSTKNISDGNDGYLCSEDFGKKTFAYNILQIINSFHSDDNRTQNLVIGLDGKWGDGKTFVINEIKNILNEGNFSNFYLFSFQPWLFAKNTNYINAFMDKLNSELIKLKCGINIFYLTAFKDMLNNNGGFLGKLILFFINKSDEELKEIIQQKINLSSKKFLIVIDDLDRLDPIEILQVFKLIRCVANFENVYFILCLDRKVVENSLDQYFQKFSNCNEVETHYCDKIINLYFEVPTITKEDLNILLDKLINKDNQLTLWKRKTDSYQASFPNLTAYYTPQNIREIKIILNKLKATSIFKYKTIEKKYESLSKSTDFYIFKILECIKLQDINLYNEIKSSILWNTPLPTINIQENKNEINALIQILRKSQLRHFYFAYSSGDLPISFEQYIQILKKLSFQKNGLKNKVLKDLSQKRKLASFFIHAINDKALSSEMFTRIVCNYEFLRESTRDFNLLFNKKASLLNFKKYFQEDYSSLTSLYTYDLINQSKNNEITRKYIDAYVETYNTNKSLLPLNNLIFCIDFDKYTPQLFSILFQKLILRNIDEAPGLLDLLDKFIEQSNGNTLLLDINIIKKQCNLPFSMIINKLENDYEKAKNSLQNYKLEKRDLYEEDDNYYQNVVTAYEKIIEFVKKHEEEF